MKLAVIGGGSTYTPELLSGIIARGAELGIDYVTLHDPRPDRRAPVAAFCRRLADAGGASWLRIDDTDVLDDALAGASFVVIQIRVGGQAGRHEDIMLGLRHGLIGQETTGVGGFAKALRTVPAVLAIAERAREVCPDAWILNFTNPAGLVTEALLRRGFEKTVGLCNVPIEMHMELAKLLGVEPSAVELDWVGLNHLGWVRRVLVDGADVLPSLLAQVEAGVPGPANIPEIAYPPGLLAALGMIPSSYVRYFYLPSEMLAELQAAKRTRAQEVAELEEALLSGYADPTTPAVLPPLLSKRGGAWYSRLAVDVLAALTSPEPTVHIVNTTNAGAVPELPADASVEVPCAISRDGVTPLPRGAVEESILGLIRQVKSYERLAIDTALDPRRGHALLALLAHPLVPDARVAAAVVDDLVARGLVQDAP
ncbi:MAG: 6-phospho-beta-glucosidase [Myxococcales bacterium]|nr:6-phospho-beta-glucosidase [Myxococcales bacterium]MCB9531994.1 6-phospho-beta-glucosidase [Myxococcales bacterium]MCB9533860.1 6-phospho-beta-glucosidase [Myxococcales bacterium]